MLLTEPLSSTGEDNLMVRSSGLSGNEAYLVARYEYTPGFESLDTVAVGGQVHYWLGDHVRLGMTANTNDGDAASKLGAGDLTLRMRPDSWFKVQAGRSEGLVAPTVVSDDGGFGFHGPDDASFTNAIASAYRADASLSLADLFAGHSGRFTFYKQNIDAGYSAPGQATIKNTGQYGGAFKLPVTNRLSLAGKGDQRIEDQGLETRAVELDATYKLTEFWSASTGVRNDLRRDRSPIVPLTQQQGERTDAVAQVMYDPHDAWRAYGFAQSTVASTGNREDNGRYGVGGSYRLTKRFRLDGEASNGDLGLGGKIGTTFLYSEGTSLYMNYALENERTDNGLQVRQGNLISGMKKRLTDSSSVYVEERYQDGGTQTGLTHATGVNLVARERWNFGANGEFGMLRDAQTFAQTDRKAAGLRVGYGTERIQLSSAVEFRNDNAEQPDTTHTERTAFLFRNSGKVQLTPDWRLLGKLNYSISNSSLGDLYNGGYTEAVLGYAYRPVLFNRLNAIAKYTYFDNVPIDGSDRNAEHRSRVHSEKPHRGLRCFVRYHAYLVHWKQVRVSHGRNESGSRPEGFLQQRGAARRDTRRLAIHEGLGEHGRGANTWPSGCRSTPPRRADHGLSLHRQEHEGWRRLQLYGFLRRPDGPELQSQRRVLQFHRDEVTDARGPHRCD